MLVFISAVVVILAIIITMLHIIPSQHNIQFTNFMHGEEEEQRELIFPNAQPVPNAPSSLFTGNGHRYATSKVKWNDVFAQNQPFLFRNLHMIENWGAVKKWNPTVLASKWKNMKVHVTNSSTVRMLSMIQPYGRAKGLGWNSAWDEKILSGQKFFLTASKTNRTNRTKQWMYLFAPVEDLPQNLHADFGQLQDLGPAQTGTGSTSSSRGIDSAGFWAGPPGISSPLHYDAAHNVYVQLFGHKRFLLFPSNVSHMLYCHSRLHPSTRSSHINVRSVAAHRFPAFEQAMDAQTLHPLEVVLGRGDVLYLPPYMWHRASVIGKQPSMSLAVYSTSTIMEKYDVLKSYPVPIDGKWLWSRRVAGLQIYTCALAKMMFDSATTTDCVKWFRTVLEQRYHPMFHDPASDNIMLGWKEWNHRQRRFFLWKTNEISVPIQVKRQLVQHAQTLKKQLMSKSGLLEKVTPEIWNIEIISLVEDIVNYVLGTEYVEPFFRWVVGELKW
jgi:hypothetical protein